MLCIIINVLLSVERGASDLSVALLSENDCIFKGGPGIFIFKNATARRCEASGFYEEFLGTDMDTAGRKHFVKYLHSNEEMRWCFFLLLKFFASSARRNIHEAVLDAAVERIRL